MIDQIDHSRSGQTFEVIEGHPNGVVVAPRIEFDTVVLRKRRIAIRADAEQNTKWRHRPKLAGRKRICEFVFSGESHVFGTCDELEVVQADPLI